MGSIIVLDINCQYGHPIQGSLEHWAVHFDKGFDSAGALKSSEYLLLAGLMGKYLLEGCLHSKQEAAMFCLPGLGVFWEKTISEERLQHLEKQMPIALAELELVLPGWELDMNRHMVTHLAEVVRHHGPWG